MHGGVAFVLLPFFKAPAFRALSCGSAFEKPVQELLLDFRKRCPVNIVLPIHGKDDLKLLSIEEINTYEIRISQRKRKALPAAKFIALI